MGGQIFVFFHVFVGSVDQKLAFSAASVIDRGRAGGRWQYFGLLFFNNCDFFLCSKQVFLLNSALFRRDQFQYDHYVINTIEWEKMKNEMKKIVKLIWCKDWRSGRQFRGVKGTVKIFLPFFFVWRLLYKDWSDQINTFFEYFFLIHFTIALKKSLRYRKCSPIIPPIKYLEHFIKHSNICQV